MHRLGRILDHIKPIADAPCIDLKFEQMLQAWLRSTYRGITILGSRRKCTWSCSPIGRSLYLGWHLRKRSWTRIKIGNHIITSVRYLKVTIDAELNFNQDVEYTCEKALTAGMALTRMMPNVGVRGVLAYNHLNVCNPSLGNNATYFR